MALSHPEWHQWHRCSLGERHNVRDLLRIERRLKGLQERMQKGLSLPQNPASAAASQPGSSVRVPQTQHRESPHGGSFAAPIPILALPHYLHRGGSTRAPSLRVNLLSERHEC